MTLSKDLAGLVERYRKLSKEEHERASKKNVTGHIANVNYALAAHFADRADELSALLDQHAVAEPQVPWLYAIQETNAAGVTSWHDGEQCVFGDRASAEDEVDCLNDSWGEGHIRLFEIVPLYRAPAHAAEQPIGGTMGLDDTRRDWETDGPAWEKRALAAESKLPAEQPKLTAFVQKWRDEHKQGWHDQECCVNDLLDELEPLLAAPVAPPPPRPTCISGCSSTVGQPAKHMQMCPNYGHPYLVVRLGQPPLAPGEQPPRQHTGIAGVGELCCDSKCWCGGMPPSVKPPPFPHSDMIDAAPPVQKDKK